MVHLDVEFTPLKEHAAIHCSNALTIDWSDIVAAEELNYVIDNPPFVGSKMQTSEQKKWQASLFGEIKNA